MWAEFAFTPSLVWEALTAGALLGLVIAFFDV